MNFFTTDATGLTEDLLLAALNVLGNDPGSAHLYSLQQNLSGCGQMAKMNTAFSALGAMITINADGTIAYDASNIGSSLAHLAEGQLATDTFVYTVRMGSGALSTAKVTLQIAGENDAPTLDSITPVNILDTAVDDTPAAVTGNLLGHDVDNGAKLTYSVANPSSVDAVNHVQTMRMEYGTLTLHTDTGAYSFLADPDKIDALAEGSTAPAVFAVTVTDEHGASATQDLAFKLIGANEAPVITGKATGSVTEDGTTTADGKLLVSAPDAGAAVGFVTTSSLTGTYGDFTFDNTSGLWDYTLRNGDANVQGLALNQHVSDTLMVTLQDGTASQAITVTVNGANDAPTLNNPAALRYVDTTSNDSLLVKSSQLIGQDIDQANSPKPHYSLVNLTNVSVSGDNQNLIKNEGTFTRNTVTGEYSFQFKADLIDALQFSETSLFQIEVIAIDDQGAISDPQYITIQAVGGNDPATITGIFEGSVTEDGTLTASGTLSVADPDDNPANPAFLSATAGALHGIYGDFTFNQNSGAWTYALRNGDTNVQALNAIDNPTDTLTVTSQDGTATQPITVTVNGSDDHNVFSVQLSDFSAYTRKTFNGFTAADLIKLGDGISIVASTTDSPNPRLNDYISGDNNSEDSTVIRVVVSTGSIDHPTLIDADILLLGFTGFDVNHMIV